ncbi:permease prefix domain 1-containing protein [Bacillaceae bacterium CLA-AA-H227]|uniref:Permease prefix domain 1-containing protein n=1 Tax=Robertmurraya yapensis (ex Hitch et al 2024) TaxID=3133160 RepID=A0ACC6S7N4_9BACI
MKKIDNYVKKIVAGLPMEEGDKEDLREELTSHLSEHVNELMIKGYSEDESIDYAIKSFGDHHELNHEMKKAIFPFYKIVRYVWCTFLVTAFIWTLAYYWNEFFHRQMGNFFQEGGMLVFLIIAVILGICEVAYEAASKEYKTKWITNPWFFFMIPSVFITGLLSISLFQQPENYVDGLWLDFFVLPIGAIAHLFARGIFTLMFVKRRNRLKIN